MSKKILLLGFILISYLANAGTVDTALIFSNSMHKSIPCVVIKPSSYSKKSNRFPVVYLLHGAFGAFNNWIRKVPELQDLADANQQIIVCPDGLVTSWYFDSPVDSTMRYETHVAVEVPAYIDEHYRTIADRKHRAITGLSMGGHGGIFLGFRHPETFGGCGSMSGALDVSLIKTYDVPKRLGDTILNKKYYNDWSAINVIDNYPKDSLAIIIDCGTEDFIYFMSKKMHEKMLKLKIAHDYIERPGKHDWAYWSNSVRYQLLFFKEFFKKAG